MSQQEVIKQMLEDADSTHKIWYGLTTYLAKWYYTLCFGIKKDLSTSKRKHKEIAFPKVKGYQAMQRMDKFVKSCPEIIKIPCDDHWHASSSLYLIPHKNQKNYMGTTVLYISQCAPEQNVFFLYPNSLNLLIKELQKIQKRTDKLR